MKLIFKELTNNKFKFSLFIFLSFLIIIPTALQFQKNILLYLNGKKP